MKNNGFDVSIWDLSSFIYPETISFFKETFGVLNNENIIRFNSVKKVIQAIRKETQETFFITIIHCNAKTYKIYRAISRAGIKYGSFGPYSRRWFPLINPPLVKPVVKNSMRRIKIDKHFITKIWPRFIHTILNISPRILGINHASYFPLYGGRLAYARGPTINEDTYVQHIHHFDYDSYLKHKNSTRKKHDNGFIVFIDQYLPNHPDAQITEHVKIDPEQYYKDLRIFFDHIESNTHNKVIIASHPKANYRKKGYLFGNREIVCDFNSAELISQSNLVLMHHSLAINFAVLFRKPILFITSDILNKSYPGPYISLLAKWFKVLPVNINDINKKIELPIVDNELYDAYISDYVKKPGTKDVLFWQQVADHIKENY